jgi:hypothetical protein
VVGEFRPLVRPGIAGIEEKICLLAVQEHRGLIDVGFVGGGTVSVCATPEATSMPICAFIPKCHAWMPPFAQEGFERFDHVIGCGHVSGLHVRPDMAAGRYGDTRPWRKSLKRAFCCVSGPGSDRSFDLTVR